METPPIANLMRAARAAGTVIPGFNIPYLPMMEPVVRALRDARCFGLVMVARLEWEKFEAGGLGPVREEYERLKDLRFTRLHLDHVPVIDEDGARVDAPAVIQEALDRGYDSVMVDGSRLPLDENIRITREIVERAHARGAAVEAELGAVLGHEAGPLPPYEELFASGRGFTDPEEARTFVAQTGVDWLSIAVGSVHGAISTARKNEKKIAARLDIAQLERIQRAAGVPLVLHGGTGIPKPYILDAIRCGIAKINIATAIRQPYEAALSESVDCAREAVYRTMRQILHDELEVEGTAEILGCAAPGAHKEEP